MRHAQRNRQASRLWIMLPLVLAMGGMVTAIVYQNLSLIAASKAMVIHRTSTLSSLIETEVANVAHFGPLRLERLSSVFDDLVDQGVVEYIQLVSSTGSVLVESGSPSPSPTDQAPGGPPIIRDGDIFLARTITVRESFSQAHGGAWGGAPPGGPSGNPSGVIRGDVVLRIRCSGAWLEEIRTEILARLSVTVILLLAFALSTFLLWRATRAREQAQHRSILAEQKARHLAGINLMASGLAHEIKNPIGAVRGFTELLASRSTEDSEEHRHLLTMMESLDEVNERINRLLSFAAPRPLNLAMHDLGALVSDVLRLIGPDLTIKKIELETEISSGSPAAPMDAARMKEVVLNLLVNALHAVEVGGRIRVEVGHDGSNDRHTLIVMDNGSGIPEEHLKKVFDPYFTTRAKGSGLGLAICKRNVENHGGSIRMHSELSRGTTAVVSIPGSSGKEAHE